MITLFNNIRLKPDTNFNKPTDNIIISAIHTQIPTDDFAKKVLEADIGPIHYAVDSYDTLLTHFNNSETEFLNYLADFDATKSLTIYVNDEDMLIILIKWYKALLRNIDVATAYKLFTLIYKRFEYMFSIAYNPTLFINKEDADRFATLGKKLPPPTTFEQAWNAILPFDLSGRGYDYYAQAASFEFQLATIAADPSWIGASAARAKIVRMVQTVQIRFVIDLKQMMLQRVDTLPGYDFNKQTVAEWATTNPEYKFLVDDNFIPSQIQYIVDNYDFVQLRKTYDASLSRVGYTMSSPRLDSCCFLTPNLTFDDVLAIELSRKISRMWLGMWEQSLYYNIYVLEWVLNNIRSSDTEQLRKLSVL